MRRLADSFGIRFYETSAKTGDNVYVRPEFFEACSSFNLPIDRSVVEKWSAHFDVAFCFFAQEAFVNLAKDQLEEKARKADGETRGVDVAGGGGAADDKGCC